MKNTHKELRVSIKEFLVEEILATFLVVTIMMTIGIYGPWLVYKTVDTISDFLVKNAEIPIIMYFIAWYSVFAFTRVNRFKKMYLRTNTIITIIVSMVLLFICIPYWWVIPLLGLLITFTYVKNKYTDVEVDELIIPQIEKE